DRAGRDNEHIAPLLVQLRNILHERDEPVLAQAPSSAVDQKRGADLDHDAAKIGKGGGGTRHSLNRRRATTSVAARRFSSMRWRPHKGEGGKEPRCREITETIAAPRRSARRCHAPNRFQREWREAPSEHLLRSPRIWPKPSRHSLQDCDCVPLRVG